MGQVAVSRTRRVHQDLAQLLGERPRRQGSSGCPARRFKRSGAGREVVAVNDWRLQSDAGRRGSPRATKEAQMLARIFSVAILSLWICGPGAGVGKADDQEAHRDL